MTSYESKVVMLACDAVTAYNMFADLRNVEHFLDKIPSDAVKVESKEFTEDMCRVSLPPFGLLGVKIVERECPKLVKYESEQSPVPFNVWAQLVSVGEQAKLRITLRADIPMMLRPMIGNKLQDVVDKMAEGFALAMSKK